MFKSAAEEMNQWADNAGAGPKAPARVNSG